MDVEVGPRVTSETTDQWEKVAGQFDQAITEEKVAPVDSDSPPAECQSPQGLRLPPQETTSVSQGSTSLSVSRKLQDEAERPPVVRTGTKGTRLSLRTSSGIPELAYFSLVIFN